MEAVKGIGSVIMGVALFCGLILIAILIIEGAASVSELLLPYLSVAISYVLPICALVLMPLALIPKTRLIAVIGFVSSSYLFGVATWMYGLIVTYTLWGVGGVVAGLAIAGVGVVPFGIVAAAIDGLWPVAGELALGFALTFGLRFLAVYLAHLVDQRELAKSGVLS